MKLDPESLKLSGALPDLQSIGMSVWDPIYAQRDHVGPNWEVVHIVHGAFKLHLDGSVFRGKAGDTFIVPSKMPHRDEFPLDSEFEVLHLLFQWEDATPLFPPRINGDLAALPHADKLAARGLAFEAYDCFRRQRGMWQEMTRAAQARGYEYIAISDHSPRLTVVNGLSIARLKEKKKEIDKLNDELPIKILLGSEVDILENGDLDYPKEILTMLDIVVASIHSRFQQDNTERLMVAMENPYVQIIGHPSGRLIGERKAYPLDYEKLFKKSSGTGTILEINSHYKRLDLQDSYIREAKRYQCKFAINTDSHSDKSLWMMELGVSWARRGWAEKEDVINTLSLDKLKKALK